MGCGGWLGLEVFVRTLMTLRGRWRVSQSRGRAQTLPWRRDRKPSCLCATVTQESNS